MLVTLLPGVDRNHALEKLRERGVQIANLRGGGARDVGDRLFGYLEWAGATARVLSYVISRADVDRLVLTRRYELLVSSAAGLLSLAGSNLPTRVLNLDPPIGMLRWSTRRKSADQRVSGTE